MKEKKKKKKKKKKKMMMMKKQKKNVQVLVQVVLVFGARVFSEIILVFDSSFV